MEQNKNRNKLKFELRKKFSKALLEQEETKAVIRDLSKE